MKAKLLAAACSTALSFAIAHAADDTAKPAQPHRHSMEKGMGGMNQGMHDNMMNGDDKSGVKDDAKPADKAAPAAKSPRKARHNHMRDHKNM